MAKAHDLTGQKFNKLTVLRRIENYVSSGGNSFVQYECICDCGRHKNVVASKLKNGHVKSCGLCNAFSNFKDLTGMTFDKLYVEGMDGYYTYPNGERDYKWRCRCECGNYITIRGNSLKSKGNHSCKRCSTRKYDRIKDADMLNKRFGKLVVTSRAEPTYTKSGTVVDQWNCVCDCGSTLTVRGASLRNGHTSSCGCNRLQMLAESGYESKFENSVRLMLDKLNCDYVAQKTFPGLVGLGGNLLSYDFCVNINGVLHLIELNGLQHYEPVDFFGGTQGFGKQKVHDFRKKQYAETNNYPLLTINCVNAKPEVVCQKVLDFLNL
jgi:hypothetical protein